MMYMNPIAASQSENYGTEMKSNICMDNTAAENGYIAL